MRYMESRHMHVKVVLALRRRVTPYMRMSQGAQPRCCSTSSSGSKSGSRRRRSPDGPILASCCPLQQVRSALQCLRAAWRTAVPDRSAEDADAPMGRCRHRAARRSRPGLPFSACGQRGGQRFQIGQPKTRMPRWGDVGIVLPVAAGQVCPSVPAGSVEDSGSR